MNRTMITATNTMSQLQKKIDLIGTNLSNVETNGYKRKDSYFSELLYQHFDNQPRADKEKGRLTPPGINQGTGARIGLLKLKLTQGTLETTGRNLDLALNKEDLFFKIDVGGTVQYTRDGAFYLSPAAGGGGAFNLVTADGNYVLDQQNRPITVNGDLRNLSFTETGTLQMELANGGMQTAELGLISVKNPQYLEHKSGNVVGLASVLAGAGIEEADIFTELTGALRQNASMTQGALEGSNVDISQEMADLINVQRQYQFQSRSITMADQMQGLINGVR